MNHFSLRGRLLGGLAIVGCQFVPSDQPASASASPENHQAHQHKKGKHAQGFVQFDEKTAKLRLLQVVFRHGARAPLTHKHFLWGGTQWDVCGSAGIQPVPLSLTMINGEPARISSWDAAQRAQQLPGGCHLGQLTEVGKQQAVALGQWLRGRYVEGMGFLPQQFQEGLLRARTTNCERTIGTLQHVLTGLFPAAPGPIPATTSSDLDEILYADTEACPHLESFMKMGKRMAKEMNKRDPDHDWAREELKRVLKVDDSFFDKGWHFCDVHDAVSAIMAAGKPLPFEFSDRLIRVVNRLATQEFGPYVAPRVADSHGHTVLRLSMGVLLGLMVENMEAAIAVATGSPAAAQQSPKLYLYSGHDSTILPLLSALGHDSLDSWPPYLSNLVFELWELPPAASPAASAAQPSGAGAAGNDAPQFVVRVLYNRNDLYLPVGPEGHHATFPTFKQEVVGSFLMSAAGAAEACKVHVSHEDPLPRTEAAAATGASSYSE